MASEFIHRQDSVGPQVIERDGVRMLQLITQLEGFRYSDLLVRPQEDKILVMDSSEKVLKSYPLPESVDPYTVEADISDEGVLTVLAPLKG
nr:small heat shock protein [Flabelliderma ockeri]